MGEGITYELSGEEVVEVRTSPALEAAAELEELKAAGNALVGKQDWDAALAQYGRALSEAERRGTLLSGDWEAERRAEKCVLACLGNQALCALKLSRFDKCKELCTAGLGKHAQARQPDPTGRAKLLFRRGQASLGLGDPRAAVDSIAEAIEVEEQQLGVKNKDSLVKVANEKAEAARIASIGAMKRELAKARRAAKSDEKASAAQLGGAKGFLQSKGKGFSDPRQDRAEEIERRLHSAFEACFGSSSDKNTEAASSDGGLAAYDKALGALSTVRAAAAAAKDAKNELDATFAEGFVGFVACESAPNARQLLGERTAAAWESYWLMRGGGIIGGAEREGGAASSEPPLQLTDVAAREAAGMSLMRVDRLADARPHLEIFVDLVARAGPLQAYHNLPDSFLLQRGMGKMDERQRRVYRWKYRAHSARAVFDAHTALAVVAQQAQDKSAALGHARAALDQATEDDEKLTAHKNLSLLLSAAWRDDTSDGDAPKTPSDADVALAREHEAKAKDLERAIADKREAEAAKTKTLTADAPLAEEAPEEDPGCETVDQDATDDPPALS